MAQGNLWDPLHEPNLIVLYAVSGQACPLLSMQIFNCESRMRPLSLVGAFVFPFPAATKSILKHLLCCSIPAVLKSATWKRRVPTDMGTAGLIVLLRCLFCVGTAGLRDAVSPHTLSNSLSASHAMSEDAKYSASDLASRKIDAEDGCCTASRTATPQHHAALQAALRAAPRNNKCYHPSKANNRAFLPGEPTVNAVRLLS
jgi:hypothetical protein